MNSQFKYQLLKAMAFAADKHRFQTRKDSAGTPYINHPVNVAVTLIEVGREDDTDLLTAAILHDTIEDTQTTNEEIERAFGRKVLSIVLEVTDDKTLSKEDRKRHQVTNASLKSTQAKKLKLADKICNVYDIINHPPANWSSERKAEYLFWADEVLQGLRGVNIFLEEKLENLIAEGLEVFQAGSRNSLK
jgi:GTP diphosphokinase / guanosine-3',5'-bis(diphosphate) 3'-diphosphatase